MPYEVDENFMKILNDNAGSRSENKIVTINRSETNIKRKSTPIEQKEATTKTRSRSQAHNPSYK